MGASIRVIEQADLPALFAVRRATWHNEQAAEEMAAMGITPETVWQMLSDSHRGWLCEVNGVPVGFTMANGETGELWVIAVLHEHGGRGIGSRLLQVAEDWLREKGWQEAWLTTHVEADHPAVAFYRKNGWEDWKMEVDRYMKKRL